MMPDSNHSKEPAGGASARPSVEASTINSNQPMATSTPGRSTRSIPTLPNAELSSSPPPAIRENAESMPSTSVPAPALAIVTPISKTTDVANSSLVQRVPRTFGQIRGRCPVQPCSNRVARSSKGRPKEEVPKTPKTKAESSKSKSKTPQKDTPKPEAGGTSRNRKRQYSPEDAISMQPSTSAKAARNNAELSLSPVTHHNPYKIYEMTMPDGPIGLIILNMDQIERNGPKGGTAASQGQGDQLDLTELTPAKTEENPSQPAENPDNTTDSLPEEDPPKTKKCLIM
ncbi:hypothetical protein KR054_010873 [Drosophila jambulina]|nr:hypothetical protein KR054_010873 [Drosophila jambulina]